MLDGWNEDLSAITSYQQLPKEAKAYLCRMIGSLLEVAYPDGHANFKLPQIRFIGVGPDPGQIISDVPPTETLIAEESLTHSVS
jgi:adenylosuccinate synthase